MNIVTEANIAGQPIVEKPRTRPVRMCAGSSSSDCCWRCGRRPGLVQLFPRPDDRAVLCQTTSRRRRRLRWPWPNRRWFPNLLTAVGDLAAVHHVNVTSDVSGRITDIMFTAGATVKAGSPLVQLFDGPNRAISQVSRRRRLVHRLALDRAKQLAARQFGPQSTADAAQATYDTANAGIAQDPRRSSRRSLCARHSTARSASATSKSASI